MIATAVTPLDELLTRAESLLIESGEDDSFLQRLSDLLFDIDALELDRIAIFKLDAADEVFEPWFCPKLDYLAEGENPVYETTDILKLKSDSSLARAASSQESFYIADSALESGWVFFEEHPNRASLSVPMMVEESVWGVVEFQSKTPNAFDEDTRGFLESAARMMTRASD